MSNIGRYTFLLIDDSEIDNVVTSKILQLSGAQKSQIVLHPAHDALDYLSRGADEIKVPDIILLDIHMPEMDGFGFLEEFDRLPSSMTEKIKVFLLTSSIDPSDIERANENRYVVRVLNKPLNMDELSYYFEEY